MVGFALDDGPAMSYLVLKGEESGLVGKENTSPGCLVSEGLPARFPLLELPGPPGLSAGLPFNPEEEAAYLSHLLLPGWGLGNAGPGSPSVGPEVIRRLTMRMLPQSWGP